MKTDFRIQRSARLAVGILALCTCLQGCSDSGSSIPYSQLPAPATKSVTPWMPLASPTESNDSPTDATAPENTAPDEGTSNEQQGSTGSNVEQVTATDTDSRATTSITPAIAINAKTNSKKPSTNVAPSALPKITADMTPEERLNLLMNNPELEENLEVLEVKLLIPEKQFRREDKGRVLRVSYDDIDLLKILNMQPVPGDAMDHFPEWLKGLEGQRIRIRGFMFPPGKLDGLKSFSFVRDNGICCFVRKPKIYDTIFVRLAKGQTANYIANVPFDVEGTFYFDPLFEGGMWHDLYRIKDATVIQ